MNALTDPEVGEYLNYHCVATYLKVGTFTLDGWQKQGGNVAAYFCRPDGGVVHAIAGQTDAYTLLREARWAVALHRLARFDSDGDEEKYRRFVRDAHRDRLSEGARPVCVCGDDWAAGILSDCDIAVHQRLFDQPLPPVREFYKFVFTEILNEELSTLPVNER